jgi:hypothetical protein
MISAGARRGPGLPVAVRGWGAGRGRKRTGRAGALPARTFVRFALAQSRFIESPLPYSAGTFILLIAREQKNARPGRQIFVRV